MGGKKMPLFDPTFYNNEQQNTKKNEESYMGPKLSWFNPWYFITGCAIAATVIYIVSGVME